jgi:hypothetical protein
MAESKFDRIFDRGVEPTTAPVPAAPLQRPEIPALPQVRSIGRPPGKRSNPAWKQFSVLLKKETQRKAADILRATDEGLDFSGLVQNLLEDWIKRQKL